jgi:beta-D-xylosidase 4
MVWRACVGVQWGRNVEAVSEDPLLSGDYGIAYTRGLQFGEDPSVIQAVVTLKHW